jgi:hypothetical protein
MVTVERKGQTMFVLKMLARHLMALPPPEQRVDEHTEQRVNDLVNQITISDIQRVSNAPPTMVANNPTSKRILQAGARTHQCTTRRNTPGVLPQIVRPVTVPPLTPLHVPHIIAEVSTLAKAHKAIQRRAEKHNKGSQINTQRRSTSFTNGEPHIRLQNNRIISQMAMNMLHLDDLNNNPTPFTPTKLLPPPAQPMNLEH